MTRIYPSASAVPPAEWPWPNFSPREFACSHCGRVKVVDAFMDKLQRLRTTYGKPMTVSSGYRCPEHNAAVSSTGKNGPHTTGAAVDIAIRGTDAHRLLLLAAAAGFSGIGVNQKGAGRFIHLDESDKHPRPACWSY